MKNYKIRQGATIEFTLTDDDITAQDAVLTISKDNAVALTASANYTTVNSKRVVTLRAENDLALGDYKYMFTVNYSDGFIAKFPDVDNCKKDCDLPTLTVCVANDEVA